MRFRITHYGKLNCNNTSITLLKVLWLCSLLGNDTLTIEEMYNKYIQSSKSDLTHEMFISYVDSNLPLAIRSGYVEPV